MNYLNKGWYGVAGLLFLCSCSEREGLAPVVEVKWREANNHAKQHIVERGDTLYAIAFRYDQDYRQLALANHLQRPYTLRVGQAIRLQPTGSSMPVRTGMPGRNNAITAKPVWQSHPAPMDRARLSYSHWIWPAHGKVVANYAPQQGKKGIDIAGHKGMKIRAAASGTVAYAGNGLSGYGNLIIIKHDNQYLTAYGNNLRNLVREGQYIKAGQPIAEMGIVDRRFYGVHFEIRKAGKPVNPLNYL